ncbi:MAG: lysozyme inhibitor LprI family protein [Pseudomonadota bacterium]
MKLAIAALMLPSMTLAQELDCTNAVTQVEMTGCAAIAFEQADADLNAAYQRAIADAQQSDQIEPAWDPTNTEMLRDAQRAWIPYRDKACAAESTWARGGTMENMLFINCLTRLTKRRADDLLLFSEGN